MLAQKWTAVMSDKFNGSANSTAVHMSNFAEACHIARFSATFIGFGNVLGEEPRKCGIARSGFQQAQEAAVRPCFQHLEAKCSFSHILIYFSRVWRSFGLCLR